MNLSGQSVLMIIAPANFRDEEYFEPKQILESAGARVVTASTLPIATSQDGKTQKVDMMLGEILTPDFDAVLFVGGSGSSVYFSMVKAHKIAHQYLDSGKVVGAICAAPTILANAGMLEGKQATSFPDQEAALRKKGANYTGTAIEVDGRIITASGPEAAKQFGNAVAKALAS